MNETVTVNCEEFEVKSEPTEGVSLGDGSAWWGTYVKYRLVGSRRWHHFHIVDVHSWDRDAIVAALDFQVNA